MTCWHYTVFALLLYGFISASAQTDIQEPESPENVTTKHILEGDNLLITCNTTEVEDEDYQDFFWVRNSTDGKHSDFYAGGWKLEFFAISRNASSTYICHALNSSLGENVTLTAIKVDVEYATECQSMSLEPRVITENETFALNCSMHGNPGPTWSIFNKDTGIAIMSATGIGADASFPNISVRCGDSGFWECSGYNRLNKGVNATRGYHLTVLCAPRPDPPTPSSWIHYFKSTEGATIDMSLDIAAGPKPVYRWSRDDGKPIHGSYSITETPRRTSLTLLTVDAVDFGNYTMTMNNSYGSFVTHFTLRAYGYPQKPYNLSVGSITDDGADITWTSGYDMGSWQRFYVMKWIGNSFIQISDDVSGPYTKGGIGKTWSTHIKGLDSNTEYKLCIAAHNSENVSLSEPILFSTSVTPKAHHRMTYAIVGSVVGVVVLAIIAAAVIYFVVKRKRSTYSIGKQKLVQNDQSKYGGTVEYDNKQPFPDNNA